jgi:tRNA(Ile)-lysidine synthase
MARMADHSSDSVLAERLAADWPVAQWAGVHVLTAVSGGADSVALLHAMSDVRAGAKGSGRIFVGHVNHRQRGAESDADEAWLHDECQRLDVPLLARSANLNGPLPAAALSESALRNERYRLLTEMAEEVGARFVAVAHTRDDQIETVLFRLLRGSGLRGLAGMPRTRALAPSVTLVRPLLACSRAEIVAYLEAGNLSWRNDATNADVHFARNRLRHDVLPALRALFDVDAALLGAAAQSRDICDLLAPRIALLCEACHARTTSDSVTLDVAGLGAESDFLVAEALRFLWRQAGWPEQAMNRRWWTGLSELAKSGGDAPSLNLPCNVLARRSGRQLVLEKRGELA